MGELHLAPPHAERLRSAGFATVESFFTDARVRVWRLLPDRENAYLDLPNGLRLHVKRYRSAAPVDAELLGHTLITVAGLPTAELVVHGTTLDGRGVIAFADLAGYSPADKILNAPSDFDRILNPTADLAARLHNASLHHRDLYLCHFLVRPDPFDLRLIDTARVARLSNPLTRRRWIVKDLAQFWFSTTREPITDQQRDRWIATYCTHTRRAPNSLQSSIAHKVARIARHDQNLNAAQPKRNISIPQQH